MADDEQEPHRQQGHQRDQHRGIKRADRRAAPSPAPPPHVDHQEGEQPDGEGQDEVHAAPTQPAQEGIPEQAKGDRDDADVDADQPEAEEALLIGLGTLDGHRDGGFENDAGGADQGDGVSLTLDPRVGNRDLRRLQPLQGSGRLHRELPVGIVDEDLRDGDRVGSTIDDVELDLVRRGQQHALHAEVSIGGTVRSPRPASVRTIGRGPPPAAARARPPRPGSAGRSPMLLSMRSAAGAISGSGTVLTDIEDPHPAELGEFGDMGVEHVEPGS